MSVTTAGPYIHDPNYTFGLTQRTRTILEPLYHYVLSDRPRYMKEGLRLLELWACCRARHVEWADRYRDPEACAFIARQSGSWFPELGLPGHRDVDAVEMRMVGGQVLYRYLDALDMVDYEHPLAGVVKAWELGSCGGEGVCASCDAIELMKS